MDERGSRWIVASPARWENEEGDESMDLLFHTLHYWGTDRMADGKTTYFISRTAIKKLKYMWMEQVRRWCTRLALRFWQMALRHRMRG